MTARERIDAAIKARPHITPGEWLESSTGNIIRILGEDLNTIKIIARCESIDSGIKIDEMLENSALIAAAPDLADEVIRLRKWQQEAVRWLEGARTIMDVVGAPKDMIWSMPRKT